MGSCADGELWTCAIAPPPRALGLEAFRRRVSRADACARTKGKLEAQAVAERSPYFPSEVRYHSEIEPTFERYVYEPVIRGVMRAATGLRVLQAGSLHAYLGYVIAMVVSLMLLVWWRT